MKKPVFFRVLFYALGLLVLALGLTLNTKTGLGVSPIISVAYSISEIFDHNFGNMTLALYSLFVVIEMILIEMILHLIRDRNGDGIVQAIADTIHKSVGFTKNCFDLTNITITIVLSFVFAGHLVGVGVGTVLAMIGVGRTIAVFNHFTYAKIKELAGVED